MLAGQSRDQSAGTADFVGGGLKNCAYGAKIKKRKRKKGVSAHRGGRKHTDLDYQLQWIKK